MSVQPVIYHIRCDGGHMPGKISDHHPLTLADVRFLLQRGAEAYDNRGKFHPSDTSSVQVRLNQGIPGIVCPREIEGPVHDKEKVLNSTYVDWLQSATRESVDAMADRLWRLMT